MKKALSLILALAMALFSGRLRRQQARDSPLTANTPLIIPPQNPPSCP